MDPEWKRCLPHCDQQLHTSQRDESNSAVSHCFNGPFAAQALSTRPLVLSRLVLGTTRNETVVSEWGKKKDLNCYYRCSCTHTRTHAQYTGRFTKGNPLREMPDFGHSDHFFIYGSPLFYLQDFAPVYESHVIRFQWITEQTGVDPQSLTYGRKHHCDYYYSAWDKAARGGEKEGARGHISPPAKINLLEDCESSMLMSLHSHVASLCCSLGLPSCKNWN